jgi:hypothetical protein
LKAAVFGLLMSDVALWTAKFASLSLDSLLAAHHVCCVLNHTLSSAPAVASVTLSYCASADTELPARLRLYSIASSALHGIVARLPGKPKRR